MKDINLFEELQVTSTLTEHRSNDLITPTETVLPHLGMDNYKLNAVSTSLEIVEKSGNSDKCGKISNFNICSHFLQNKKQTYL